LYKFIYHYDLTACRICLLFFFFFFVVYGALYFLGLWLFFLGLYNGTFKLNCSFSSLQILSFLPPFLELSMAVVVRPPNKCILCAQANKTESSIWCRHKMQLQSVEGDLFSFHKHFHFFTRMKKNLINQSYHC